MAGPVFLEGDTVDLRTIEAEDLSFIQEARNHPGVWRGTGQPNPMNGEQQRNFFDEVISSEDWVNLLVTADPETPVGTVAFTRIDRDDRWGEIAYWIAPAHQQEGYGTEAVALLVDYGFRDLGFHRIMARMIESNDPSRRLVESLGFTHEGTFREHTFRDGSFQHLLCYGMLKDEWELRQRNSVEP